MSKTIVITGGSDGLGKTLTETFSKSAANLYDTRFRRSASSKKSLEELSMENYDLQDQLETQIKKFDFANLDRGQTFGIHLDTFDKNLEDHKIMAIIIPKAVPDKKPTIVS